MTQDHGFDAEVAILGYGPTGVAAANCLGARGIRTIAFERDTDLYQRARAVTVSDWTCRYFQAMGLDHEIKQTMDETYMLRWLTYDGQELNRLEFPPSDMGHARSYAIYQPAMEQVLRDGGERYSNVIDVRYGVEVVGVDQDEDGVTVTARNLATQEVTKTRVRYVLGCYGGNAATREMLGVELTGSTAETRWIVIDARVKRWWPNRNVLTFWSDAKRPVVDIALARGNHRWELPLGPGETDADFQTEEQLWALLTPLGVTPDDVEIHQHAFYNHHVRAVEQWRRGCVFLLGDAAHLMPPWAGAGMQSGIRDAFCLSWRLEAVLRGRLPETALDTYQAERAPDVERYTQIAVGLGRLIQQQMSEEELAAMQPPPDAEPTLPPLLQDPELMSGWIHGPAGPDSAVGKIIPQPRAASSAGMIQWLDDLLGGDMVLLGADLDPKTLLTPDEKAAWDKLDTRYVALRPIDGRSESAEDIVDLDGTLIAWMQRHNAKVIAVRPDRFVAAADSTGLMVPA